MNLCINGHDKDVVGTYGVSCKECNRLRCQARRDREKTNKKRRKVATERRRMDRRLKPVDVERAMDLRDRAKWIAMPWEREKLLAEAEAIEGGKNG